MRTRFLLAALLLGLVACSAPAGSQAPASDAPASAAAEAIAVSVMDFMIEPTDVEAVGPTVTIDVMNDGPTPHNLTVRDANGEVLMGTEDLSVGDTATISGDLEPGDYTIFCALPGHESLGMSGTLTVTAP
jgi:plastocyanin